MISRTRPAISRPGCHRGRGERTGRSKTYYAREAIVEHLDDLEDYYLAVARLEKELPTLGLDEMERRLGVAD